MVGNIIIYLWSRTRIVTEFFKRRTTLQYVQRYLLGYLEIHNLHGHYKNDFVMNITLCDKEQTIRPRLVIKFPAAHRLRAIE